MQIFVINLKKDSDRRRKISQQLDSLGVVFSFFEGVNGRELKDEELLSAYKPKRSIDKSKRLLTQGEIGCALSHFNIYQKMLDENIDRAIVLEDDAVIGKNFLEAIDVVAHLPCNWEIFLLGYSSSREIPCNFKLDLVGNSTVFNVGISPKSRGCLHGYVISKSGAERMLSYKDSLYQPIDMYTADYRMINSYVIYPRVVYQNKDLESSIGYEWESKQGPKWKQQQVVKTIRKLNNRRRSKRNKKGVFSISCLFSKLEFLIRNNFRGRYK